MISSTFSETVTLEDGSTIEHGDYKLMRILMGGDKLTVARASAAKCIRLTYENSMVS